MTWGRSRFFWATSGRHAGARVPARVAQCVNPPKAAAPSPSQSRRSMLIKPGSTMGGLAGVATAEGAPSGASVAALASAPGRTALRSGSRGPAGAESTTPTPACATVGSAPSPGAGAGSESSPGEWGVRKAAAGATADGCES